MVIPQRIRDAEREMLLNDFMSRGDKIFVGTVKRLDKGDMIVESGRVEGRLKRSEMIPKENFRSGDRVRAMIMESTDAARRAAHPAVALGARVHDRAVPPGSAEIEQGLLEIKKCARDPGSRIKIAVLSHDKRVDPIGTCVGVRGSRVNGVTNEARRRARRHRALERDPAQFVIGALAPANVQSIVVDEERGAMDVVVDEENLAIAIGRGGQNVRLASDLTGWRINIMTADESAQKQASGIRIGPLPVHGSSTSTRRSPTSLIAEGFTSLEEVAYVAAAGDARDRVLRRGNRQRAARPCQGARC